MAVVVLLLCCWCCCNACLPQLTEALDRPAPRVAVRLIGMWWPTQRLRRVKLYACSARRSRGGRWLVAVCCTCPTGRATPVDLTSRS